MKNIVTLLLFIPSFFVVGQTLEMNEENGFLTIPVQVDNKEFTAVIDTGSYPVSFFYEDITKSGLKQVDSDKRINNNSKIGSLTVGDINEKNLKVSVFPKERHRSNINGNMIILGQSFLSENNAVIDTEKNLITLNDKSTNYKSYKDKKLDFTIMEKGAIITYVTYNDKKHKMILDTGTYPVLLDNTNYLRDKGDFLFYDYEIKRLDIQSVDFTIPKREENIDGILGLEFLKSMNGIISYPDKTLYYK